MIYLVYTYLFLVGLILGSFLNVVIYRVPLNISVAKGRSFCPKCGKQLKSSHLIPLFSYLCLGGKCGFCKAPISPRYPLVELATGLLTVGTFAVLGLTWQAALTVLMGCILLAIAMIDLDTMTIPNGLVLCLAPVGIGFAALGEPSLTSRVIGMLAVSVPLYLLTKFIKDSFGGGDVKLMAVAGFVLGWQNTLLAFFIAVVTGGLAAVGLLSQKKAQTHMPFGPYICLGVYVAALWGQQIISWYLGLFL